MAIFDRLHIRWLALVLSGLTFLVIAVLALFFPHTVASAYAYTLGSVDSYTEFRAIFIGFWIGLAALLFTAAKRLDNVALGDLGATMILCQALGRLLSFVLDGLPSTRFLIAFALEMTLSLAALLARPRLRST